MITLQFNPHISRIAALTLAILLVSSLIPLLGSASPALTGLIPASSQTLNHPELTTQSNLQANLSKLPLYFIENHAQLDRRVHYYLQGQDKTLYFTSQGVTFALSSSDLPRVDSPKGVRVSRWTLELEFVDANPGVKPAGQGRTPAVISYFKGPQEKWQTDLPTYTGLVYPNLWPGIDLVYSGDGERLKYTFVVQPGADPSHIRLAYRGVTAVELNPAGELTVITPLGSFYDERPLSYQEIAGRRVEVTTAFTLESNPVNGVYNYGFQLSEYDRSQPLVIDPAMLVYAGYIGGSGNDRGYAIAVDSAGNAYITGLTTSDPSTFPDTVGPTLIYNGNTDAFVAKVKADGSGLDYAGYIGGSGSDYAEAIAVDGSGNAYITGYTESDQTSFPVTFGPDLKYNNSGDAFVAKVNSGGTALVYCGYLGGSGEDDGKGIAVDGSGNAYITGYTASDQSTFPDGNGFDSLPGPDQFYNSGDHDAFVAKVKADGSGLDYAGYIGGGSDDSGNGIAVDGAGNAYISGHTTSSEATFPDGNGFDTHPGLDQSQNGSTDAFVAKVKTDGSGLDYAGYIGGSNGDIGRGIAVDSAGNAYITGYTAFNQSSFPDGDGFDTHPGLDQSHNGGNDAFVAKVKADGSGLDYAGYIGGDGDDEGWGIVIDGAGNAYIAGITSSDENTFPDGDGFGTLPGPDQTYNGGENDAFVAKVKADGSGLDYAGYIGGEYNDYGRGIAVDSTGNAYITGYTKSTEATFPVTIGPGLTYTSGDYDAFVAKLRPEKTYADPAGTCGSHAPCFTTIAAALGAVMTNGSVDVSAGTYTENVTLDSNVNLTLLGATILNGNLTLSAGTFNAPDANTLALMGNLTYTGGSFNPNSGTVIFGNGTPNLAATAALTFTNLTVDSGVTLVETNNADNITVAGTLTNNGTIRKSKDIPSTGNYTFGLAGGPVGGANLNIYVTSDSFTSIQVERIDSNHPNATTGIQTGRYWTIAPTGSGVADITLPVTFTPDANAKVCRYTGSGQVWDCALSSFTANTITRNDVTTFSDWAAGNNVSPTANTLQSFDARPKGPDRLLGYWVVFGGVGMLSAAWIVWRKRAR